MLLVPLAAGILAAPGAGAVAPRCAVPVQSAPAGLPAPVRIVTPCAAYTVLADGQIRVGERPRVKWPSWMAIAGEGARVVQRGARIAVLRRDGRELWRSRGSYRAAGVFAKVGPRAIVFSYEQFEQRRSWTSLFVAPLGRPEREVAVNERPLGWTRAGGLLTWRFRQGFIGIYLRSADGTPIRRIAARLREVRFETASRSVLALSRSGLLQRYDGRRWHRLANVRALRFRGREPSMQPLAGGLIGLLGRTRVAVVRGDGTLFASASFRPDHRRFSVAGNSGLVADAAGTAVALAVTSGNNGYAVVGRESLYVLRAGDRRAREVYAGRLRFAVCERWVGLDWHGDWLLYASTEGRTIALDTRSPARRVDLTGLVARVARADAQRKTQAQVEWAR
jgi:hypothetical protein